MPTTPTEKIFVNGMISKDVPDTAPDFVLGKGSFEVDNLINFLNEHKQYAVDGWLNYSILRSKGTGKRYVELDLYQFYNPKKKVEGGDEDDWFDGPKK